MATLQIDCRLTESQINKIVRALDNHISLFAEDGINDYQDEKEIIQGIKVFVEFDAFSCNRIGLKAVEILNDDYDLLEKETIVLKSYLKPIILLYNEDIEKNIGDGYDYREELAKERYYNQKYGSC